MRKTPSIFNFKGTFYVKKGLFGVDSKFGISNQCLLPLTQTAAFLGVKPKHALGFPMGLKLKENQNIWEIKHSAEVVNPKKQTTD